MVAAREGGQKGKEGEAALEQMLVLLYEIWAVFLTLRLWCKVIILMFTCHELSCYLPVIWCTEIHLVEKK